MKIEDKIHAKISSAKELTPLEIVKIIQDLTGISMERAIKGYYYYKSKYINKLKYVKEHESFLNSPNLALLAFLDLRVRNHTTEEESV